MDIDRSIDLYGSDHIRISIQTFSPFRSINFWYAVWNTKKKYEQTNEEEKKYETHDKKFRNYGSSNLMDVNHSSENSLSERKRERERKLIEKHTYNYKHTR